MALIPRATSFNSASLPTLLDAERKDRPSPASILILAACGVVLVGAVDYVTGYEVSTSLFYLGPVAVAAWYAGRWPGVLIALTSCVSWYVADVAAGHQYFYPAIPIWNALVRFGFFVIASLLLTALRESLLAQRQLAQIDDLTGLYGRRVFTDRLEHDLALAQRRRSAITLAYVDLDNFKALNDGHGHAEGDRVLRATGGVLKSSLRQADTAARIGGDEFALLLPDTDGEGAQQVIGKIARELREALAASPFAVIFSIGVVTFSEPRLSAAEAVAAADALMYAVKRKGKGGVAFEVVGGAVPTQTTSETNAGRSA
jgi:diguanylate cyclase (GGDEF)-like protein